MSMTKESMADKIVTNLETCNPAITPNRAFYIQYWECVSQGIIEEITMNMSIETEVTVSGIQTGSSTVIATGEDTLIE